MENKKRTPPQQSSKKAAGNHKAIKKSTKKRTTAASVNAVTLRPSRRPQIQRVARKDRAPFPVGVVCIAIILTFLLLFMVMNFAEINKYNSEIASLNSRVDKLKTNEDALKSSLEQKEGSIDLNAYARDTLGMVDGNTINKEYVSLIPEDKTEMYHYDEPESGGFGMLLAGIGEVINGFFND